MNTIRKFLVVCTFFFSISLTGQQAFQPVNMWNAGFHISQNGGDFGVGAHLTSKAFANEKIAIRARYNFSFYEGFDNTEITWFPYHQVSLGLIGFSRTMGIIRLYGEGGVFGIFPNENVSSEAFSTGGYGYFGFEFFLARNMNYFIELGGMGHGARADQQIGNPPYANGFTTTVGFRIGLGG